jgi:hypothetical protein
MCSLAKYALVAIIVGFVIVGAIGIAIAEYLKQ